MKGPRPEKVAVVEDVRQRLEEASASVVTEYRGLDVGQLAELRRSLGAAGEFKIYKNTLVRRAVADGPHEALSDLLSGPTAIAFVHDELSAVAKALRDFSRTYPQLVVKGGLLDGRLLDAAELAALADLPSKEVLLARLAGALQAPLRQLGALMEALPRNLAYGLKALADERTSAVPPEAPAPAPEAAQGEGLAEGGGEGPSEA